MDEQTDRRFEVFYDGKCPMCASLMGRVERSAKCGEFDLRDMHAEKRLPFKREAVEKEIHVVDRDGQVHKGAQGILKIAGQYRGLGFLEKIGAVPLVRSLLPIGYRFVAANRRFLFGPASRIYWLKVIVVLVSCLGLAMSPRLWIGPRSYPLAPVFDFLPQAGHPVDYVLFAALFALAAAMLVSSRPQKFIAGFLAIIIIFCALDQTRWQPWRQADEHHEDAGKRSLQRWRRRKIIFREILGVVRFSTFATVSARNGHGGMSDLSPLSGVERKSDFGVS